MSLAKSTFGALRDADGYLELGNVVDDFLHSGDVGGFLFWDFAVELFFNGHDQFNSVKGIGTKVIHEGGRVDNLVLLNTQLGGNDLLDLVFNTKQGCADPASNK